MQILESTVLGLRSARLAFTRADSSLEVTLFPMVHVGERQFYDTVYGDAMAHDVVLMEGLGGPIARRLTRAYRWLPLAPKMDLVMQSSVPYSDRGPARLVLADLSEDEFASEWRSVPWWLRFFIQLAAPLGALKLRRHFSRAVLAKNGSVDDFASEENLLEAPAWMALSRAIVDARDRRLLEVLDTEMSGGGSAPCRIAVIYGAEHIRTVARHLTATGFRLTSADWRTVLSL